MIGRARLSRSATDQRTVHKNHRVGRFTFIVTEYQLSSTDTALDEHRAVRSAFAAGSPNSGGGYLESSPISIVVVAAQDEDCESVTKDTKHEGEPSEIRKSKEQGQGNDKAKDITKATELNRVKEFNKVEDNANEKLNESAASNTINEKVVPDIIDLVSDDDENDQQPAQKSDNPAIRSQPDTIEVQVRHDDGRLMTIVIPLLLEFTQTLDQKSVVPGFQDLTKVDRFFYGVNGNQNHKPDKFLRYDDRSAVLVLGYARTKNAPGLSSSKLYEYSKNFDWKNNIRQHYPGGEPAIVEDVITKQQYYLCYGGVHALWGEPGGTQTTIDAEGRKITAWPNHLHKTFRNIPFIRHDPDRPERASLMAIKYPFPQQRAEDRLILRDLPGVLFVPFVDIQAGNDTLGTGIGDVRRQTQKRKKGGTFSGGSRKRRKGDLKTGSYSFSRIFGEREYDDEFEDDEYKPKEEESDDDSISYEWDEDICDV